MRAITGAALAAVLLVVSTGARAQDDDPKFDPKLLVGKWEPAGAKMNKAEMEFKKGGKLSIALTVDDTKTNIDGTWDLKDDKLSVTVTIDDKEAKSSFRLKKLDDATLEYVDEKDKTFTLKRVKP